MTFQWNSFAKIIRLYVSLLLLYRVPVLLFTVIDEMPWGYPTDSQDKFTMRSTSYGHTIEEHIVSTEDGYILSMFHILTSEKCIGRVQFPPLILMHGFLMSSDAWLDSGPEASLAYLLSDACFDVWLGNVRGNYHGRRHKILNPDEDPVFWNFSADEMGLYDIPAAIDYVTYYTGTVKVNYVGFSQGAAISLVMCSERPSYCDKVGVLVALAPGTRLTHTKSRVLRVLSDQLRIFEDVLSSLGIKEVFPKGGWEQKVLSFICKYKVFLETVCRVDEILIDAHHRGSINMKTRRVMFEHFPAGTSVHTFARYGQASHSKRYQKFDYGKTRNIEMYGRPSPPYYNMSAVSIPVVIMRGRNDHLVDVKDIQWLTKSLPNVLESVEVVDPQWNHFDFMYSQYTKQLVFPTILKYLTKYSDEQI